MTSTTPAAAAVTDIHAHMVPSSLLERLHHEPTAFPNIEVTAHESTYRVAFNGGAPTRPINPGLTDVGRRLAWLDENHIDRQVVGGWLDVFGYELDPGEGEEWSDALTRSLADTVRDEPRLVALGTVPLQDPQRAAAALLRQHEAGLPGIMIATRAGGRELDDDAFTPFWEAADQSGAIVLLHPGFGAAGDRYRDFGLVNGLARLEDTTVTLARMLYAGVPARFANAKIIVAHAGAALPYVLGRLIQNHLINKETTKDPVESFSQLYFDSVVFDHDALALLVGKVGADRVLLGSDYPFPIGDLAPRKVIGRLDIPGDQRARVEGANAEELIGARG